MITVKTHMQLAQLLDDIKFGDQNMIDNACIVLASNFHAIEFIAKLITNEQISALEKSGNQLLFESRKQ